MKPLAAHLLTNVAANTIVVKMSGGDQVVAAATAGALASVTSCIVEHQLGITQTIPKMAASAVSYTVAAMIIGERVSLPQAATLGLASSAVAGTITRYVSTSIYRHDSLINKLRKQKPYRAVRSRSGSVGFKRHCSPALVARF